jgi:phospholipid/cholesterol/gamma-HCH transport system substrate-binding protein
VIVPAREERAFGEDAAVRNSSVIGRAAAIAAVVVAVIAVAVILLSSGSSYKINAVFQNASQIVSGDLVQVSGSPIGKVSSISLTPQGQAKLTLDINNTSFDPLHAGTIATVRQSSLSGIANRYIDLRLGPATAAKIPAGGTIPTQDTTSAVDLDQIFNTLDPPTRKALQDVIQGSASQYASQGKTMQRAWAYLNPAIASSSVLFREINRDTNKFTQFIVKSGNLVSDVAQRRTDLSALIQHLATTTQSIAAQRTGLSESLQRLPGFMTLANTTFVNLRSTLNQLTPLVDASKPVAPKLQQLLVQLKPFAQDSVPTVRDLANIVSRSGKNNDLTDLVRISPKLADVTVHNVKANGKTRPGAFPQSVTALNNSTPELATARPYAVDLTGWFEGYTHPGTIDANGGTSRVAPVIGLQSLENGILNNIPAGLAGLLQQFLGVGAPGQKPLLTSGQGDRCPGSQERGGVWYPESGFPCNPNEVPTGP